MGGGLFAAVFFVAIPFAAFLFVFPGYGAGRICASTVSAPSGSCAVAQSDSFVLTPSGSRAGAISAQTGSASQDFVINEVLYDPEGPDEGLEFVELYNPTDVSLSLKGLALETGNGAKEGDWALAAQWESDYYVEAHGYVVIGEDAVSPPPQFIKQLDLQNGPDACRIRRATQVVDLIGWGSHTFPEYYEGTPCEDVASGVSVGRLPDGVDTQDNSADFKALSRLPPADAIFAS